MSYVRRVLVVLVSVVVGLAGMVPAAVAQRAAASTMDRASTPRAGAVRADAHRSAPETAGRAATLGYWVVASNGGIFSAGTAAFQGSPSKLAAPIVGMAATPSGHGYWQVASDGGIFAFGDAAFHGSTGAIHLNEPIVGIAATPSGRGYWMVASDGGIFSFGDAVFHGSTGAMHLNQPIVGMAATPSGNGYWLVASDGGVFSFGDAVFHGSTGAMRLHQPIVGMSSSPTGDGYRMVASDGGIFSYGDAPFEGSTGAIHLAQSIVGMTPTASGDGYWFVARDGGVFAFGDAQFYGSLGGSGLTSVVGMAASNAVSVGGAAKLAFRTQPSDSTGNAAFATQPQVAVEDASGAVVATDTSTVTLSLTNAEPASPARTLTCTDRTQAAVAGVATFAGCRIDRSGTYTLTATDGSLASAESALVTITVGPAARLRFLVQPSGAVVDVALTTQPVVAVVDAGNNVVESNTSAVTLALTAPAGASLGCTANPKAAVAGIATFADCAVNLPSSYTLTATDGSLSSAVSTSIQITGTASKVAFTIEPSGTTTGGAVLVTQPQVTVEDSAGHTIEADTSNVTLTLTSAGGATLSCTTNPAAAVAGVATFAGCNIDRPGTYTLTATDGSLATAVSTSIVVSLGAAEQVVFTTQPVDSTGGTALATQPVVTIEDTGGNVVTSDTSAVTLALTTPGGATLSCTANPVHAVAGVATFVGCAVDHANTYTLTATDASLASDVSGAFTVGVGAATHVAFTTQPAGAVGGTPFTAQPVVAIEDAGGNTVSSDSSSVTLAITTPAGAALACTANPKAAVAGVATFAACAIDLAGPYTLTATDASLTAAISTSFTNAIGAASQLVFTTEPSGGVGGSAFTTQPVVAVQDAGGNAVATDTSSITLTLTTAGGAILVCAANPRAAIAGVATFSGCNVDLAGDYTLTASDGLLAPAVSDAITITPGTATQLLFTTQPSGSTGGVAFTTQPVVAVADAIGNTVTGNATAVTLAITTPAGATLACTANPKTAVSGVATFSGCNIDQPGTYTLTATDASLTAAVSTDVVIEVGPAAQLVFTTQPGDATAGTALATQPVVTVEDAGGNTVTDDTSSVTLALAASGGATLACATNPVSAVAGVATFAGCNVDLSGTFVLTASATSLTTGFSDSFAIAAGPPAQLAYVGDPIAGSGGTPFTTQPQVAVEDAFGNIVRDDTSAVTLAPTSGVPTFACTTNPVNAVAGVATFSGCTIDEAGVWTLDATDASLTLASTDVAIEVGAPTQLAFSAQPSDSTGGVPFATQPAVTVQDAGGNTVTDDASPVVLSLTSAGDATLDCPTNPTGASSGVATFVGCNIDVVGTYSLTAQDASLTEAVSSSITISVGDAAQVAFTTRPSSSTGGLPFATQPEVTVEDAGGNPVTADTSAVSLEITTPAGASLTCDANPVNAVAGVATFSGCSIDLEGPAYHLRAFDDVLTPAVSGAIAVAVGPPAAIEFERQPASDAETSATLTTQPIVRVVDAGGNTVTSDASSVLLTLSGSTGNITCTQNPMTTAGGEANFAGCQIDTAGTYTITASDGGLIPVDSNDVTVEDPV